MSVLRWTDISFGLRATIDEIQRPWAAFVGLVALRTSRYAERESVYALNASRGGFPELGQAVVVHPDDLPAFHAEAWRCLGRPLSDDELAAWLYWVAHRR